MSEIILTVRFKEGIREGKYTRTGNRDSRGAIHVNDGMALLAIKGETFEIRENYSVHPYTHTCNQHGKFHVTLGLVDIIQKKKINTKAIKIWKE